VTVLARRLIARLGPVGLVALIVGWLGASIFQVAVVVDIDRAVQRLDGGIYESRAVGCRVNVALNIPLQPDGPCMDPRVLEHYTPDEVPRLTSLAIACAVLRVVAPDATELASCPGS
jgi:hypothetical protein